ncbi:MAG: TIGR04086 family membrane protein [Bacteroides sp.]|nr:TIGR04086 family membrane protein [Eubacterium sp.]MCM1418769.1 TIGR04086 family membrane protein [Roseburia sp.]MCM1462014.1 TIGR04086 family membrane protein [Bacteroides sp.]
MSEHKPDLRRAATYALSSAVGGICTAGCLAFSAWLICALGVPLSLARLFALFSLGAGCMLAGFLCGRIKRRHGLKSGFVCAVVLLSVCMLGALFFGTINGVDSIAKTLTAVLTGCTGGVLGVNRESR